MSFRWVRSDCDVRTCFRSEGVLLPMASTIDVIDFKARIYWGVHFDRTKTCGIFQIFQ